MGTSELWVIQRSSTAVIHAVLSGSFTDIFKRSDPCESRLYQKDGFHSQAQDPYQYTVHQQCKVYQKGYISSPSKQSGAGCLVNIHVEMLVPAVVGRLLVA